MKIPHWLKCRYDKWVTYEIPVKVVRVLADGQRVDGDTFHIRQNRNCSVCNKEQDRKVR